MVAALAAVNAVGDVIDPATGRVVAGVRTPDGAGLADARTLLRAGAGGGGRPRENTTLGVVATNAALTQAEATTVAQMAHDGLARAIVPAHTPSDGDAIFALATGRRDEPVGAGTVGALAAEAMAEAIVRAVRAAARHSRLSRRAGPRARPESVNLYLVVILGYADCSWRSGCGTAGGFRDRLTSSSRAAASVPDSSSPPCSRPTSGRGRRWGRRRWAIATASAPGGGSGSAGIGSIVLAFWVGPRLRRLAEVHDLRTVGDFLEHRYGREVRTLIAALLWVGTLAILAGQIIAMGAVLHAVSGLDPWIGSLVGGIVVTVYFTAGGLLTSVRVNAVQLAVLLTGFLVVSPLVLASVGGLSQVVAETRGIDGYWNFWQGGGSGWFLLAMIAPSFIYSPGILQRVYAARDDRAVRWGSGSTPSPCSCSRRPRPCSA